MIAPVRIRSLAKPHAIAGLLLAGLASLGAWAVWDSVRMVDLRGRVILSPTGEPVCEALIAVESTAFWEDRASLTTARTDCDGRFVVKARGEPVIVKAWKPGYSFAGVHEERSAQEVAEKEFLFELRVLPKEGLLEQRTLESGTRLALGDGFSFSAGRIVSSSSGEADVVYRDGRLEALGDGGLVYIPSAARYDLGFPLYERGEAPADGYQRSVRPPPTDTGLFFVRTRDGKHFAKFILQQAFYLPPGADRGTPHFFVTWAYQPDGSRMLELSRGERFPFPVRDFGIDPKSLTP